MSETEKPALRIPGWRWRQDNWGDWHMRRKRKDEKWVTILVQRSLPANDRYRPYSYWISDCAARPYFVCEEVDALTAQCVLNELLRRGST